MYGYMFADSWPGNQNMSSSDILEKNKAFHHTRKPVNRNTQLIQKENIVVRLLALNLIFFVKDIILAAGKN